MGVPVCLTALLISQSLTVSIAFLHTECQKQIGWRCTALGLRIAFHKSSFITLPF
jgi:hypothetical protein